MLVRLLKGIKLQQRPKMFLQTLLAAQGFRKWPVLTLLLKTVLYTCLAWMQFEDAQQSFRYQEAGLQYGSKKGKDL